MNFVRRIGTKAADHYPLPIHDVPAWAAGVGNSWRVQIELPEVPADHIIVPSFAMLGPSYQYQFSIHQREQPNTRTDLMWVPSTQARKASTCPVFAPKIDCWHTLEASHPRVELEVFAKSEPRDTLLTLSVRPLLLEEFGEQENITLPPPKPISQMMGPPKIARGICSPTALSMAIDSPWAETIDACYDQQTKAYGCWPLAIHWASAQGVLGAVEALSDWQTVGQVLRSGHPVVCSINFAKGELSDAPLDQTSGHLVVLYGIEDQHVLVMDPAAASHAEVPRRYVACEFARAWLRHRGAAYIFSA